jgi:hypothetical protein
MHLEFMELRFFLITLCNRNSIDTAIIRALEFPKYLANQKLLRVYCLNYFIL